ncbi:MAG: hypothetical protein QXF26_06455 [Candidatus Bathyarchaeia archaeon]
MDDVKGIVTSILIIIVFSGFWFTVVSYEPVKGAIMGAVKATMVDADMLKTLFDVSAATAPNIPYYPGVDYTAVQQTTTSSSSGSATTVTTSTTVKSSDGKIIETLQQVKTTIDTTRRVVEYMRQIGGSTEKESFTLTNVGVTGSRMAAHPKITGLVNMRMRIYYSDNTYRDIDKMITVDIVGALIDSVRGKQVSKIRLSAQGVLKAEGLGDYGVAVLAVQESMGYYGAVATTTGATGTVRLPTATSFSKLYLTKENPTCTVNLAIEKPIEQLLASNRFTLWSALDVKADFLEFAGKSERDAYITSVRTGASYSGKILRAVSKSGFYDGPSLSTLYSPANPGGKEVYQVPDAMGTAWQLRFTRYPSLDSFEVLESTGFKPYWADGTLKFNLLTTRAPSTYTYRLEPARGRWSGLDGTASFTTLDREGGAASGPHAIQTCSIKPKAEPVTGTLTISFQSITKTTNGTSYVVQDDEIKIYVYKWCFNTAKQAYEETLIGSYAVKQGSRVKVSVTLSSWQESIYVKTDSSKYGGVVEWKTYNAGDWYTYCLSPSQTLSITATSGIGQYYQSLESQGSLSPDLKNVVVKPANNTLVITVNEAVSQEDVITVRLKNGTNVFVATDNGQPVSVDLTAGDKTVTGAGSVEILTKDSYVTVDNQAVDLQGISYVELSKKKDGTITRSSTTVSPSSTGFDPGSLLLVGLAVLASVACFIGVRVLYNRLKED